MDYLLNSAGADYKAQHGVGYNWFDFLGMGGTYAYAKGTYDLDDPCYPELDDSAGWDALISALDDLKPGFIRFGLPPDPHIDQEGSLIFDTVHMERLKRVAAWAAQNGCTILLDTFLVPERYVFPPTDEAWKAQPTGMFQMAARDNRALAREFLAPLLNHVCVTLNLKAVKFFNPVNEPFCYGVYQTPGNEPDACRHYVAMYRELRHALDDMGVSRDRLGLVGMDLVFWSGSWDTIHKLTEVNDIDPWIEAYSVHYYKICFDHGPRTTMWGKIRKEWEPMQDLIDRETRRLAEHCAGKGKPLWATEIGTFRYGFREHFPGPACYEALLTMAEAVVRCLNVGVSTFAYWSLLNPDTIDGRWSTFSIRDGRLFYEKPAGVIRGALSQAVRPGAIVHPLQVTNASAEPRYLHAVALTEAEGARTILLVNDHPSEAIRFRLVLPEGWTTPPVRRLLVTRESQTLGDAEYCRDADGLWTSEIPPLSLCVQTDRNLAIPV